MNRRNFIRGLLAAGAGFAILPGAGRLWKVQKYVVFPGNPNAPYDVVLLITEDPWKRLDRPFPHGMGETIRFPLKMNRKFPCP